MLVVKVYEINQAGHEQVIDEYRLVDGEIAVYPAGNPVLEILQDYPRDGLLPPDPEDWLRDLCDMMGGSYLYAGRAEDRPDDGAGAPDGGQSSPTEPECPAPTGHALEQMSQRIALVRAGVPPGFTIDPTPGGTLVVIYGPGFRVVYSPLEEKIVYRGQLTTMRAETIVRWMHTWLEHKGTVG